MRGLSVQNSKQKSAIRSDPKAFFYESFAGQWEESIDRDELGKRLRVVFGRLLNEGDVRGRRILDAGAGTGFFSAALAEWGGNVIAVDVGQTLLNKVLEKNPTVRPVLGSILDLPFRDQSFELVLSSEVIEHTVDMLKAVTELCRVTARGGLLLITTPNRVWHPAIRLATALRLRPYHGYENWVGYRDLANWICAAGFDLQYHGGFNLLPHTFFCRPRFDFLDSLHFLHPWMINMAILARRPLEPG
jgi:2-polyprenyl-3-methyl-5-hydroxy-6-metoxy-1,4-benzoquinol methylase